MGIKIEFEVMEAVPGGNGRCGWREGRRGPRAKVVECELGHGEEQMPEIRGKCVVSGGEDGEEVIVVWWFGWHVRRRGSGAGRVWRRWRVCCVFGIGHGGGGRVHCQCSCG